MARAKITPSKPRAPKPAAEEQAFLNAILAAPDDDTPRLVFADWLDERGTGDDAARAALIRAQCRAEALPAGSEERHKLEREAKAVLKQHGGGWTKTLMTKWYADGWAFRRGFLDSVEMSATMFTRNAKALFEQYPTVRTARFPDASNELRHVAKCAGLSRLTSLDVSKMCMCGFCSIHLDLKALFASKYAGNLTALNVARNRMGTEGMEQLIASPTLTKLTALDISNNPIGRVGLLELGRAQNLQHLETLNLSRIDLGAAGLNVLGGFKNLPALRHLALSKTKLAVAALAIFLKSPLCAQLVSLDLSKNALGALGAKHLATLPATAKLESLDVRGCGITPHAARALKKRFGDGLKV